jgi:three-Cys-motif partner protein
VSKGGATFVDPFCGPGRSRIRQTTRIIDGSSLVAVREAQRKGVTFSEVHVADLNPEFLNATKARLRRLEMAPIGRVGNAKKTVPEIVASLPATGLHFAFLDPYDLASLPFSVIRELAAVQRMDMLIHMSLQDLTRNLRRYIEGSETPLDAFVPGWRSAIVKNETDERMRQRVFESWLGAVRGLDMQTAQGAELVTGSKEQPLYWLIFAARHDKAIQFWNQIRNVSPQRDLGL